jgi:hypothetical protein
MPRRKLIALDSYANETYGCSISSAIVAGICVRCGKPARLFTTEGAAARYPRVGLCERCQRFDEQSMKETVVPFDQHADSDTV